MEVKIAPEWKVLLQEEFEKPYFTQLTGSLRSFKDQGKVIYPKGKDIFRAFELTSPNHTKVVILGQDPYHGPGQAHGISFSVPEGISIPPSLQNIFKELNADLGVPAPSHGDLSSWATQGVLLLNASLTVEAHMANAHKDLGWQHFTDAVIRIISDHSKHTVFILWGNFARSKKKLIDTSKHLVIESAHPSPLSAHNGFFGSSPFSKANEWLQQQGETPVNWRI